MSDPSSTTKSTNPIEKGIKFGGTTEGAASTAKTAVTSGLGFKFGGVNTGTAVTAVTTAGTTLLATKSDQTSGEDKKTINTTLTLTSLAYRPISMKEPPPFDGGSIPSSSSSSTSLVPTKPKE